MRVLILSSHYHPEPVIGSARPTAAAAFLRERGHKVNVLTRQGPWGGAEANGVIRTAWLRLPLFQLVRHSPDGPSLSRAPSQPPAATRARGSAHFARAAHSLLSVPDVEGGWIPFAYRAGAELFSGEPFDVIWASGPSFGSHVVASLLSRRFRAPWVADYRDLWSNSSYYAFGHLRRKVDRFIEDRVLSNVSCATAATGVFAADLQRDFGVPSTVVRNGYDKVDVDPWGQREALSRAKVNVLYVGNNFYSGKRTPRILFAAARQLSLGPDDVRFHFLGSDMTLITTIAREEGVESLVSVHASVPQEEAIRWQSRADVLMLLLWQDPAERGTIPGKLFEYAAVRRPVVLVGWSEGEAAQLIRRYELGQTVADESAARSVLRELVDSKRSSALGADIPVNVELSREAQCEVLERVLLGVVGA